MKISAKVQNSEGQHHVTLRTKDLVHSLKSLLGQRGSVPVRTEENCCS